MTLEMSLFVCAVMAFTLVAAISDSRTKRLPNWLTMPALAAGLAFHAVTGGWSGLWTALGGFGVGFGVLLVLWLIGGGGGGDVKLMGALGAWLGPAPTFIVVLMSAGIVMVATVGRSVWELSTQGYQRAKQNYIPEVKRKRRKETDEQSLARKQKRRLLPFAVPVAFSTWFFLICKVVALLNESAAVAAG
ncbi:MAG: A24 family peptidase [Planctomycetota bacterium]|nr:A24 family peptidase [Planctomycetota bacterium]